MSRSELADDPLHVHFCHSRPCGFLHPDLMNLFDDTHDSVSAASSHQCRWASGVSHRDCRTEALRRTGPALSLSNGTVLGVLSRSGSPPASDSGLWTARAERSQATKRCIYSQRPGPLGRQGRSDRPARLHSHDLRRRRVKRPAGGRRASCRFAAAPACLQHNRIV